mmetsp:Transcript_38899/g.153819  ORF Transcript_38899/g.153819 Transcript_38899/m.153819 type:complete len:136 (-) Transcript_38899:1876-2283(-)
MGISSRTNPVALDKGMVLSNEPGYYEAGAFGIRIESVIAVRESKVGDGSFLEFEQLTFVPIDKKLVDVSVMSPAECDWLDDYHALIDEKVSPLLNGEPLEWLRLATAPIDRSGLATRCDKKTWPLQDSRQRRSVH